MNIRSIAPLGLLLTATLLPAVEKRTIARNDHIYSAFPDITRTRGGALVLIYRESMGHGPLPFSRLIVRRSLDGGDTWTDRHILLETVATPDAVEKSSRWLEKDAIAGYNESRARIHQPWLIGASINCPRLLTLADGSLFLIADLYVRDASGKRKVADKIWRSTDQGATWNGPEDLRAEVQGIVPQILQLRNGHLLLGLNLEEDGAEKGNVTITSTDGGRTWTPPVHLPETSRFRADETGFVELANGAIVGFGRNRIPELERRPSGAVKVISRDGGKTWHGPFETWLLGCEGRPHPGLLTSGEVAITYRFDSPNEMLAMHVMTQAAAELESTAALIEREPFPEDIPARLAREHGQQRPWYMRSYYGGRTVVLDIDRSVHRDGGYSSWVEMPSGDIFAVDYLNDDAPLAQIRGYLIRRSDYILFPPGDLPWLHPSGQPFRSMTDAMGRRQIQKNGATR